MSIKQIATQLAELAGSGIYASYKVANAVDIARWSKKVAGTKGKPEDARELHCTSCYSKTHFDATVVHAPNRIKLPPNKGRRLGRLGDGGAVVLFLADDEQTELQTAWKAFMDAGAHFGFPSYVPHITVAYDSNLTNEALAAMPAYDGPIMFHNLTIEPIKDKGETAAAPKLKLNAVVRVRHPKTGKLQNGTISKLGATKAKIAWDDGSKEAMVSMEDLKALTATQLASRKAKLAKEKAPVKKVATPKTGTVTTKAAIIKDIKAWIKEYSDDDTSDAKAEKLKKKIYDTLDKHQIKREEVGLKPIKAAKPIPKPPAKTPVAKKPVTTPKPKVDRLVKEVEAPIGAINTFGTKILAASFKDATTSARKLSFMKMLWEHLNKVKFQGQMRMPNIGLQKKVNIDRMRRRGVWYQEARRLDMSPHIFNNADKFYEIFLHEMCHQAVSEITKFRAMEVNQGHGPIWQSWMVKVGLNPNRFDYGGNDQYRTEEQLATKKIQQEVKQKAVAAEKPTYPSQGKVAKWHDPKTGAWHEGIIVVPNDQAGKRWVFVQRSMSPGRWMSIPSTWFYEVPVERHELIKTQLKLSYDAALAGHTSNKELRSKKRQMTKDLRDLFGRF